MSRQPTAYSTHLESRYFLSFSVDLECICVVRKLVFPQDGLGGASPPRDCDIRFTAHVYSHGAPMHHVPVSTSASPQRVLPGCAPDAGSSRDGTPGLSLVWDEVISFPVKVSDLGRNARLVLTAWTPSGDPYGGTSVPLFDSKGALCTGLQKLRFFVGRSSSGGSSGGGGGDGGLRSSTPGEVSDSEQSGKDYGFKLAKAREAFETGSCARVSWLDSALLQRADAAATDPTTAQSLRHNLQHDDDAAAPGTRAALAAAVAARSGAKAGGGGGAGAPLWWSADDLAVASECWLEVELPTFAYPIVHEERRYQVRQEALPARALPAAAQLLYARALSGDSSVDAPIGAGLSAKASRSKAWAKTLAASTGERGEGDGEGGATAAGSVASAQAPPSTPTSKRAAAGVGAASQGSSSTVTRGGLAQPALDLSSNHRTGGGATNGASGPSTPGGHSKDSSNHRGNTYSGSGASGSDAWVGVVPATVDYENDALVTNPSEDMRRKLMMDQLRGNMDPDLKPDTAQRKEIDAILAHPSDILSHEQKDLLWLFGYTLVGVPNAVVKFVLAVSWENESEVATAKTLLNRWQQPDIAYALKLLSDDREFQHPAVRSFAVRRLEAASDSELELYLLQLVAALRYEPEQEGSSDTTASKEGAGGESASKPAASSSTATSAGAGALGSSHSGSDSSEGVEGGLGPLANFLIQRACTCAAPYSFANFCYWFLKVESEADEKHGPMFRRVFTAYTSALPPHIANVLADQHAYVEKVSECQSLAFQTKGNRDAKQKEMSKLLKALGLELKGKRAPSPINPHIVLKGVDSNVKMYQSALYPAAVTFSVEPPAELSDRFSRLIMAAKADLASVGNDQPDDPSGGGGGGAKKRLAAQQKVEALEAQLATFGKLKMMIKNGDDVRQDQLVLQMFRVMDHCLKRVGLDLKLTIYGCLATSPKSGIMEFVCAEDGSPSSAIELLDTSITDYLKKHCPGDDSEVAGVSQEGLEAFASSMAGYAVLTYILAVGDRHLGNLLVLPNGRMCHIDFGFVFGDDPKKKFVNPPPFRITKGMVDAMGGQKGDTFQQVFCRRAFGAYKELRHNAVLVMSLLRLMKDSGIEALEENREAKLQTVEDRFRLDLNDEDAEAFMAGVIQESMTHVGIQVLEGFHNIARILR